MTAIDFVHELVGHGHLDHRLRQQADVVLAAAIDRLVALLASVAPHFGDGHARHRRLFERLAHFVDLVWTDDALDRASFLSADSTVNLMRSCPKPCTVDHRCSRAPRCRFASQPCLPTGEVLIVTRPCAPVRMAEGTEAQVDGVVRQQSICRGSARRSCARLPGSCSTRAHHARRRSGAGEVQRRSRVGVVRDSERACRDTAPESSSPTREESAVDAFCTRHKS